MPRHNIKATIFSQSWKILQPARLMLIQSIWFVKIGEFLLLIVLELSYLLAIAEVWREHMQVQGEHL